MKYAITFQSKYQHETHSVFEEITNRSWMEVEVPDGPDAPQKLRQLLNEELGNDWAFDYELNDDFRNDIVQFHLVQLGWKFKMEEDGEVILLKRYGDKWFPLEPAPEWTI